MVIQSVYILYLCLLFCDRFLENNLLEKKVSLIFLWYCIHITNIKSHGKIQCSNIQWLGWW